MKNKKFIILPLIAIALVACGNHSNSNDNLTNPETVVNTVVDESVKDEYTLPSLKNQSALTYQTSTSLMTLSSMSSNSSIKFRKSITDEDKATIKELLPTIDLLINNAKFESEISASDIEGYEYKQTISLVDFASEDISYTLYYNVVLNEKYHPDFKDHDKDHDKNHDHKHNHDNCSKDEIISEEIIDSEILPEENTSDEVIIEETESAEIKERRGDCSNSEIIEEDVVTSDDVVIEDDDDDVVIEDDDDDDEITSDDIESKYVGIVKIGEETYDFVGKNEVENDHDEIETELKLKIFTSEDKYSYIKVEHETEIEDDEIEEEYKYEIVENKEKIYSFKFEHEVEENEEEAKIKLNINDTKYSFKAYEKDGEFYIRVRIKDHKDGHITFKKVIVLDEENNIENIYFEEI